MSTEVLTQLERIVAARDSISTHIREEFGLSVGAGSINDLSTIIAGIKKSTPSYGSTVVTIPQGYLPSELSITVSTGDADVLYGYVDSDGNFQEIDISGNAPADTGEAVPAEFKVFNTGKNEPDYVVIGGEPMPVVYGVINSDGRFQQLDMSGDVPETVGEAIDVDSTIYNTNTDEPEYLNILDKEW